MWFELLIPKVPCDLRRINATVVVPNRKNVIYDIVIKQWPDIVIIKIQSYMILL